MIQRKKSCAEILKTDRKTAAKLEQNRNEGAVDIVVNKGCTEVDPKVNETHVTNNRVQRGRLKIAKRKIVDSRELSDTNNVSLTSKIVRDYKRGNFKAVTSPPVFMADSADLMQHSEVDKKMVETVNSQDKELLVLRNVSEGNDSLNLQNVRISTKVIEKEKIREGVETSKQNGVDITLLFIWSELLQDDKDLNSKLTTSRPVITIDYSSAVNHSDFHANEVKDEIFNTQ